MRWVLYNRPHTCSLTFIRAAPDIPTKDLKFCIISRLTAHRFLKLIRKQITKYSRTLSLHLLKITENDRLNEFVARENADQGDSKRLAIKQSEYNNCI